MSSKLPGTYEKKYTSKKLKEKITDIIMWSAIPVVTYSLDSPGGRQRIKENDILFSFIDKYFPDFSYAFEPNMQDGRFMFLPDEVRHQGIGVCASPEFPGFLEVGHFWYPREFTAKGRTKLDQLYIPMFSSRPDDELAEMIREIYTDDKSKIRNHFCTFPFFPGCVVTLKGDFLDTPAKTEKTVREALAGQSDQIRKNGEAFIQFMRDICT